MRCQILKIPSKDNATRLHKKQQVPPKCAHKLIWLCSHVNEALWSNWLITYTMKMQIPLTFFQCVFYRAIMHNVGHWKLGGIKLLFSNLNNIQISRLIKKEHIFLWLELMIIRTWQNSEVILEKSANLMYVWLNGSFSSAANIETSINTM